MKSLKKLTLMPSVQQRVSKLINFSLPNQKKEIEKKMIKISSARFGEFEISEEEIITFPLGIPGIPFDRFIIKDLIEPVKWLIAIDDTDVAMLIVSPFKYFPNYSFELNDETCSILQANSEEELEVYVALLQHNDGVAANLKSPFVINRRTKIGVQILLEDDRLSFREPIKK